MKGGERKQGMYRRKWKEKSSQRKKNNHVEEKVPERRKSQEDIKKSGSD